MTMVRLKGARNRWRLALAAVLAAGAVSAIMPVVASAHSGPPSTYFRCTSRYASGDNWRTFSGVIYGSPWEMQTYWTRIVPAWPYGWSGTWSVGFGSPPFHSTIWIPVGTSHWYQGPVFFGNSSGTWSWMVNIRPNPGVFNNYRLDIFAPHSCS